jgi:hypothetical protein
MLYFTLHFLLHVLDSLPCWFSIMHVHFECLYWMPMIRVHAACPRCMSMLSMYCMSMLLDHAARPTCISMLHGCAACPCCLSMLHAHASRSVHQQLSDQIPATPLSPLWQEGPSSGAICLGSATATTATPSRHLAASRLLFHATVSLMCPNLCVRMPRAASALQTSREQVPG